MATEAEIREAERTRLEGLVDEHGTEREQALLLMSGIKRSGISLARLAEAAESGDPLGRISPDPDVLAKLARRVERRTRLKLPQAECAADPPTPYCDCLERAIDQPGDDGKRAVLELARAFHQRTKTEPPAPLPPELLAEPEEAGGSAEDPLAPPEPASKPEPKPETPVRVVRRRPKWYDPTPQSFRDMRF